MASRIRAFDWASTSLGPADQWPTPLKTTVGVILRSPVPIVTLWGPQGIMIYNDAYSGFAGGRHPQLLGSPVREGWPEVADFNDNVMKVVLSGGVLSYQDQELTLHRSGSPEQVWMNLDYSPVTDEAGRPIGVIAIVVETTARVNAETALRENEARLRFLDALGKETARSMDADAILAITTRMLGEHLGVAICAYADMEPDEDHFTIRGDWSAPGSPSIRGYYSLADFGEMAVRNLSAGQPLIINDNLKEIAPNEAATFQAIGIGSTICMPLVKEGRLTALMAIHHKGPHRWTDNELALLSEVTERSWAHIERVRSDEASRQAAERLTLATRAAAIGTWDFDPATGHLRWDDRCKELFGLPPEADVSYDGAFLAGLHPDDRDRVHEAVTAAISPGGKPYDIEFRTVGIFDQQLRWISATGNVVFQDGTPVRFIGTVRDISAQKRTEQHLRVLNDTGASVAAQRDLETIVQTVTDAGLALSGAQFGGFFENADDDGGARYALYAPSGASREAFADFPMPRGASVFPPGEGVVRADDILADPRFDRSRPHRGIPEGQLSVRSYLAVPVVSRSGEVLGGLFYGHEEPSRFTEEHESALLGIAGHAATAIDNVSLFGAVERELAERRRAEEALQSLNATLEQRVFEEVAERARAEEKLRQSQKMEAIGNLTGGIAHDFNNLLAAVLGSLELLRKRLPNDPGLLSLVDNAIEGAVRGTSLTSRMLAFARRQDLKSERIDVRELVQGMADLLRRSIGPTVAIDIQLSENLPLIDADANQLESALLNLMVNARDATQAEGTIVVSGRERHAGDDHPVLAPGSYLCLSVSDNGSGMDEATLARATEPFFTTKGVGKGTGLGLSMVQGLAEQSGGTLVLTSTLGTGTTAEIWLPTVAGTSSDALFAEKTPSFTSERRPMPELNEPRRLSILAVDDDALVLMNTVAMLEDLGHDVAEATSGKAALAIFQEKQFDLVITDHAMPHMTGAQLAVEIENLRPGTPIVLATGYAELPPGVDTSLPRLAKPFWQTELEQAIAKAVH